MLENSLVLLPGVGIGTEDMLWRNGIHGLSQLQEAHAVKGISRRRLKLLQEKATDVLHDLDKCNYVRLANHMPGREMWRFLSLVNDRSIALDVESARFGRENKPVVLSLCSSDGKCMTLVRGDSLSWHRFDDLLRGADFIITYNGSSFDLPLLRQNGYRVDGPIHIDLRRYSRRANLMGGLKDIERCINISRPRYLEFSTSAQVSYLWRLWESRGCKNALDLLIAYNQQDARSLIPISRCIYERLQAEKLKNLNEHIWTDTRCR